MRKTTSAYVCQLVQTQPDDEKSDEASPAPEERPGAQSVRLRVDASAQEVEKALRIQGWNGRQLIRHESTLSR